MNNSTDPCVNQLDDAIVVRVKNEVLGQWSDLIGLKVSPIVILLIMSRWNYVDNGLILCVICVKGRCRFLKQTQDVWSKWARFDLIDLWCVCWWWGVKRKFHFTWWSFFESTLWKNVISLTLICLCFDAILTFGVHFNTLSWLSLLEFLDVQLHFFLLLCVLEWQIGELKGAVDMLAAMSCQIQTDDITDDIFLRVEINQIVHFGTFYTT